MERTVFDRLRAFSFQIKRRAYFLMFRDKVKDSLARRTGSCGLCGGCCDTAFRCPYIRMSNGMTLCRIHRNKPLLCKLYPYSKNDFFHHLKHKCTYRFKKPDTTKSHNSSEHQLRSPADHDKI